MPYEIKENVQSYFSKLDGNQIPSKIKEKCSVILSGSSGWGIEEGSDALADWDLHVIMPDDCYKIFIKIKSEDYIIDDQSHTPKVFIQFHNMTWIMDRLNGMVANSWPLYLWIYTNCMYISDPNNIKDVVSSYKVKFNNEIDDLIKRYHILFSTRRLDTCSSAKRGLKIATSLNCAEMVKSALQLMCLLKRVPFAYNKWLEKEVEIEYHNDTNGMKVLNLCKACLYEENFDTVSRKSKELRDYIEGMLVKKYGEKRWIHYWWEFNKN